MTKQDVAGFMIDDWRVSPPEGLLSRDNETARLEPKAMEVLVYLASHPGEVITREELEQEVWHGAVIGYDAVTNTVIKLRKALQDSARQPRFIATIPKKGYQLIAPITFLDDSPAAAPSPASEPVTRSDPRQQVSWYRLTTGVGLAILAGILIIVSLVWLWTGTPGQPEPATSANHVQNLALPSIAVLPFENLGGNPQQEYLADGITEDIITDLSRLSNVLVIASNTSFTYKGRQVTVKEAANDLNVVYVLKGSVRQLGDAVRINAQLVNTATGFNAWAQRYDRKTTEIFMVQDEVTQNIVKALAINITSQETTRLTKNATASLKAYDFFQEGQRLFKVNTKEANQQANEAYRNAIELDPGYGRAYGALAVTLVSDFRREWTDAPVETLDRALVLAKQAVALDGFIPQTYWALSFAHLSRKEYDKAEKAVEQAISIAPNYADAYGLLALMKSYLGEAKTSINLINKAIRLNPHYTFEYLISYGIAYYTLGDYEAAIGILEEAQIRNENSVPVKMLLAASYIKADRQNDAEWAITELLTLSPTITISSVDDIIPIAVPEFRHALLEDLRQAGLSE